MTILIPLNSNDFDEAKIVSLQNVQYWIIIEHDKGKIIKYSFYNTFEEIADFIDIVILNSENENSTMFIENGSEVLFTSLQLYIEDILEAYIFRELHTLD